MYNHIYGLDTWHYTGFCLYIPETYTEPCKVSVMEHFAKIVTSFQLLTIFAKRSILDVSQRSEYAFANRDCKWGYGARWTNSINQIFRK